MKKVIIVEIAGLCIIGQGRGSSDDKERSVSSKQ